MEKLSDLSGAKRGQLYVLRYAYSKKGRRYWECLCSCGNTTFVATSSLNNNNTTSCGCVKRNVLGNLCRVHGRANSRLSGYKDKTYGIWQAFRDRCKNANRKDYHRYGGRGITYDPAWDDFMKFVDDMGDCPEGLTLDRIDNNKGYFIDNCRWATRLQQSLNSTRVKRVCIDGQDRTLKEWLEKYNLSRYCYYDRLKRGWNEVAAITTPKTK